MRTSSLIVPLPLLFVSMGLAAGHEWSTDRVRHLEQAVEAERQRQQVVGVTVAVSQNGVLRMAAGFGKSDLENDVPARKETMYRLASISKPITAIAALQLAERGKLDLDAPVQRYVPAFGQKQWPVTLRDMLGHLGGVRHYQGAELDSTIHYTDVATPLRIFAGDPLLHAPRSKYLYTTYGFNLIGAAVETAARMPFIDYLRENIFKPAGMTAIRADDQQEIIPNRSRGYARTKSGRIVNCGLADTSNKIPGGGLISTVFDLVSLANAYETGVLLSKKTMLKMQEEQRTLSGKGTRYGLGWNVGPVAGRPAISHGGSQQGTRTLLVMYPSLQTTIVIMANSDHAVVNDFASAILKALDTPSSAW